MRVRLEAAGAFWGGGYPVCGVDVGSVPDELPDLVGIAIPSSLDDLNGGGPKQLEMIIKQRALSADALRGNEIRIRATGIEKTKGAVIGGVS